MIASHTGVPGKAQRRLRGSDYPIVVSLSGRVRLPLDDVRITRVRKIRNGGADQPGGLALSSGRMVAGQSNAFHRFAQSRRSSLTATREQSRSLGAWGPKSAPAVKPAPVSPTDHAFKLRNHTRSGQSLSTPDAGLHPDATHRFCVRIGAHAVLILHTRSSRQLQMLVMLPVQTGRSRHNSATVVSVSSCRPCRTRSITTRSGSTR